MVTHIQELGVQSCESARPLSGGWWFSPLPPSPLAMSTASVLDGKLVRLAWHLLLPPFCLPDQLSLPYRLDITSAGLQQSQVQKLCLVQDDGEQHWSLFLFLFLFAASGGVWEVPPCSMSAELCCCITSANSHPWTFAKLDSSPLYQPGPAHSLCLAQPVDLSLTGPFTHSLTCTTGAPLLALHRVQPGTTCPICSRRCSC